jgi:heme A synthase
MITTLYMAHSGLRYMVLLAGILALVYFLVALSSRRPQERAGRILMAAFVGLVDLQVLLGLLLVFLGIWYPALMGHLVLMVLAAAAAHAASVLARRAVDSQRAHATRLVGVVLTLLLIAGGIMAIGRGIFETRILTT